MSVTIIDIARDSNTSKSTVSRYLNGMKVKADVAKAIETSIDRLDYHPNVNARRLVTKKTLTLGVVVEDISNVYFSDILAGIQEVSGTNGYSCTFYSRANNNASELDFLRLFREGHIDGLILGTFLNRTKTEVMELAKSGYPIVLIGDSCQNNKIDSVDVDNKQGTYDEIEYLHGLGHRYIGYLKGPSQMCGANYRYQGFLEAAEVFAIPSNLCIDTGWTVDTGKKAMLALLDKHPEITAVACSNDHCAYGAMLACKELGLTVPDDITVVAFDDGPLAKFSTPSITTVKQPFRQLGQMAARQLINTIGNTTSVRSSILLQSQLIVRESSTRSPREL
jgi:LacI family transcriptional regulator/LacI family repressor for deo operon, udp, cdd, tsx, nupC, and nupG